MKKLKFFVFREISSFQRIHFLLTLSFWLLANTEKLHKVIRSEKNFKLLLLYLLEIYLHCFNIIQPDERYFEETLLVLDYTIVESNLNKHISEFDPHLLNYSNMRGKEEKLNSLLYVSTKQNIINYKVFIMSLRVSFLFRNGHYYSN